MANLSKILVKREHCLYPSAITLMALLSIVLIDNAYLSVILVTLGGLMWFSHIAKLQAAYGHEKKQYETISNRVKELKSFSLELESMVNKELALVQEDVVRIRGLVADSIDTLQSGISSIHDCTHAQCEIIHSIGIQTNSYPKKNSYSEKNSNRPVLNHLPPHR
ncbi:MAG: hypothetical protein AAFZ92_10645 [Pseudomonadota bacterium]